MQMFVLVAATATPVVDAGSSVMPQPWWLAPALTGFFVLVAAFIALGSLWLSDRRKLKREDARQWDRELREIYVELAGVLRGVYYAFLTEPRSTWKPMKEAGEMAEAAEDLVSERRLMMELFAPKSLFTALEKVAMALGRASTAAFYDEELEGGADLIPEEQWRQETSAELLVAIHTLRKSFRDALRR